jgi:SAM-dependent methyltransferase
MSERLDALLKIVLDRLFGERPDGSELSVLVNSKLEAISRAVARLSDLYTRERADLRHNLLQEPDLRLAYLAYFLPSNFLKINAILEEIWQHPRVKSLLPQRLRILDLGCGPGTHLLGCLDFFSEQLRPPERIECVGVDSLESNLQDALYLFHPSGGRTFRECGGNRSKVGAFRTARPICSALKPVSSGTPLEPLNPTGSTVSRTAEA